MRFKYFTLLILIAIGLSSCKKVLDKEPLDFLKDQEQYYNTEEKLEANIRGVYDILQSGNLYGFQMLYITGFEADEGYYYRSTSDDGPQLYNFSSGNARVSNFWTTLYSGIGRANALLANVDTSPEIPEAKRNSIRGEALFLRGYYYFMLVQTFGGVPLILSPVTDVNDVDRPRASAQEVYDQIIKDMEAAEEWVPGIRTLNNGGRISKSAVRGILARVCLHNAGYPVRNLSKYAEARKWAKKVIDDTEANHSLNKSFSQVFINYAQNKYDVNESIWEIEFSGNGNQGAYAETGGVGYLNSPASTSDVIGNSFGGVGATAKLYNIYTHPSAGAPGAGGGGPDLRRDWTIASFKYVVNDHSFITSTTPANLYTRYAGKFRREYETLTPKHRTQTSQNFPLLRFSDVLLMFAEADYEVINQGTADGMPSAEAIAAVEKVRDRAMVKGGIRSFVFGNTGTANSYTAGNPPTITLAAPAGGTDASIITTVAADGRIALPFLVRDPVTGAKMGSGYTGTPRVVITPALGGVYATIRTYPTNLATLTTAQLNDFRKAIQDERFRELAFETLRKNDLIRWGIFVFEMKQVANHIMASNLSDRYYLMPFQNVAEKHNLWPIPAREMNLNKKLVQNSNW
ncbi:RagB/SusD family nutrient uptake outer membrane protein [Pedobacter immunditicola]|uniref:RagB/SusD family nutrient uptake outer membrane protein n=1 Tax=Pedobacter immunditicola TaxID=3133440 RepID=UPI00309CF5C6